MSRTAGTTGPVFSSLCLPERACGAEFLGPLGLTESLKLVGRVADALSEAHRRGLVHRDIKPSNLLLQDGDATKVKLLDYIKEKAGVKSFVGGYRDGRINVTTYHN